MALHPSERRGWLLVAALAAVAVLRPVGCGGHGKDAPSEVEEAVLAVLADTWPQVVDPALGRAEASAGALQVAVDAWAEAEREGDGAAARVDAQGAWIAAMGDWEQVELLRIGPLGSSLNAVGGQDLGDRVYSWPTTNPCGVDQETVRGDFAQADFLDTHLVTAMGFDALEVLLWSEPGVNACAADVDINTDGSWAALGADAGQQARAEYAAVLVGGLSATMAEARGAWEGPFGRAFAAGDDPYDSPTAALNASYDALFRLETQTKDNKLGEPLGLRDCGGSATCAPEGARSGTSRAWLAANLAGGRLLFTGGDGEGFDDLLAALGQGALSDDLLAAFDDADAAVAAMTGPVDADPAGATAAHAAIDALCALLREDLATVLALKVPSEAAGDND